MGGDYALLPRQAADVARMGAEHGYQRVVHNLLCMGSDKEC